MNMIGKVSEKLFKINFLLNFSECRIDVEAVMIAKGLHYFNSVLNPIIYSLMNQQFKKAFKHLFRLTYSNITGKTCSLTRSKIDRQLSCSRTRGSSSLKSRSSTFDKANGVTTELCSCPEKSVKYNV